MAVRSSVCRHCERLGGGIPAATDKSRYNRFYSTTAKRSTTFECHRPSEMSIMNECPVSQRCGALKNLHCSLPISAEYRSHSCYDRSPYELYILDWDDKSQLNKQIVNLIYSRKMSSLTLSHFIPNPLF